MEIEQVRHMVSRRAIKYAKNRGSTGLRAWCEANGINVAHASEFMNGNKNPGSDLLRALGLEWRVMRRNTRK